MIYIVCDSEKATEWFLESLERKTKITWLSGHKPTEWIPALSYRGFCIEDKNTMGQIGDNPTYIYNYIKETATAKEDAVILIK